MHRSRSLRSVAIGCSFAVMFFVACSSVDSHPPASLNAFDEAGLKDSNTPDTPLVLPEAEPFDAADLDTGVAAVCANGILDVGETDVDCGGPTCNKCKEGNACVGATDCQSGACTNLKCTKPGCSDGLLSPGETDIDCGGKECKPCTYGKRCLLGPDCASTNCDLVNGCKCPVRMVVVTLPGSADAGVKSAAYCVDETEVTNGDYDRFIKSGQSVAQQITSCKPPVNTSYVPTDHWPPTQPLGMSYPLPVRNVDWCDAKAFCKWAGKELCGLMGGSPDPNVPAAKPEDQNVIEKDAWFNACTAQGTYTYPYGLNYQPGTCNGDNGASGPKPVCVFDDMGTYTGLLSPALRTCQGGATGLYEMSGNIGEWEDSCCPFASSYAVGSIDDISPPAPVNLLACGSCTSDLNCGGTTPICDLPGNKLAADPGLATYTCRGCADLDVKGDGECASAGGPTKCQRVGTLKGACRQCSATDASQCPGVNPPYTCAAATGTCTPPAAGVFPACRTTNNNADCVGNTPICDAATKICRACTSNADCAAFPSKTCSLTGVTQGQCTAPTCKVRGGSYKSDSAAMKCGAVRTAPADQRSEDIGFRCCQY